MLRWVHGDDYRMLHIRELTGEGGFLAILKAEVLPLLGILSLASFRNRIHMAAKVERKKAVRGLTSSSFCAHIGVSRS